MEAFLGTPISVFIGMTLVISGGCAAMTGHATAGTWRSIWQAIVYTILLGFANRFLIFALFEGELLSISNYLFDTAFLLVITITVFRITQVKKMVNQYPWLYESAGLFGWREIPNK